MAKPMGIREWLGESIFKESVDEKFNWVIIKE